MSGFSRTQLRRENSCKKPLLEDTAGPVELLIVGVTILSFNSKALCGSSFSLWPFHSIMDIIFYIVRIKGNLAAHLFLQVIWEAKRSAGESRFFRKTEHISWHFWKGNNTTTDLKVSKNGTCKLYKKKKCLCQQSWRELETKTTLKTRARKWFICPPIQKKHTLEKVKTGPK